MGLNAAVYKRIKELPFTSAELRFVSVDPITGEVDFENATLFNEWSGKVRAIEKRLGNVALIRLLKEEVEDIFGKSSSDTYLVSKVLYSGTHSGDIISAEHLYALKQEIASVREVAGRQLSSELVTFLTDMEELADESERHGNPIVFI